MCERSDSFLWCRLTTGTLAYFSSISKHNRKSKREKQPSQWREVKQSHTHLPHNLHLMVFLTSQIRTMQFSPRSSPKRSAVHSGSLAELLTLFKQRYSLPPFNTQSLQLVNNNTWFVAFCCASAFLPHFPFLLAFFLLLLCSFLCFQVPDVVRGFMHMQ